MDSNWLYETVTLLFFFTILLIVVYGHHTCNLRIVLFSKFACSIKQVFICQLLFQLTLLTLFPVKVSSMTNHYWMVSVQIAFVSTFKISGSFFTTQLTPQTLEISFLIRFELGSQSNWRGVSFPPQSLCHVTRCYSTHTSLWQD